VECNQWPLVRMARPGVVVMPEVMGCQHWSMSENFCRSTPVEQSAAFSPDGQTLASGSNAGIKLWDVSNGKCLRTYVDIAIG